jgi:hypothetical protein
MVEKAESRRTKEGKKEGVDELLGRLHLHYDEVEDFVWED